MRHDPLLHRHSPRLLSARAGHRELCRIDTVDRRAWAGRAIAALAHGPNADGESASDLQALEQGEGLDRAFARIGSPTSGLVAVDDRMIHAVLGRGVGLLQASGSGEAAFDRGGPHAPLRIERPVVTKGSLLFATEAFWRRIRQEEAGWILAADMPLSVRLEALLEIAESATRRAGPDYGLVVLDIG